VVRRLAATALPFLLLLALPGSAAAHAVLVDTVPERGTNPERAPERVVFRFNEPVETAFGSVRVFDSRGRRVDTGGADHPGGDARAVAVGLKAGLPDGGYTATYRVISADSHPVSGGFVFSVGDGGAAPAAPVDDLIASGDAGVVTDVALGAAKALTYAAIAVAAGGLLFLLAVWLPALREVAGADDAWRLASESFVGRLRRVAAVTVATGAGAALLGVATQAASAAGSSAWDALDPQVIADMLGTRAGTTWGLRLVDWALLGVLLVAVASRQALPALRPASLGAVGQALPRGGRLAVLGPAVILLGFLVLSPALAGHAGVSVPTAVLFPANVVHVLAMSAWIGGLALLLLALPAATRRLQPADRTRLLSAALLRFSPIALGAVTALLATGILQSLFHLTSVGDLFDTAFGRAILIKAVLLAALIALGALNRRRSLPRLRRIAAGGGSPGDEGRVLRRTLRTEIALLAGALAVTAALTSYPPPDSLAAGPFSTTTELGAARMELTVDPAAVGSNEIHIYLTNPRTGAQFDRFRNLNVTLALPAKRIGPLEPRLDKAGPGHWVIRSAQFSPAGDWRLTVSSRVSDFVERRALVEVPVE
jgi:copper transport protein